MSGGLSHALREYLTHQNLSRHIVTFSRELRNFSFSRVSPMAFRAIHRVSHAIAATFGVSAAPANISPTLRDRSGGFIAMQPGCQSLYTVSQRM